MVQIREMNAEDASDVSRLYIESWTRTYETAFDKDALDVETAKRFMVEKQAEEAENPDKITLVAVDEGKLVGASLSLMDDRHQAWIERLHVVKQYFGTGLADDMMRAILIKHTGLQSIALKVLEGNERAIGFYKRHGFTITEHIYDDEMVGGASSIIMTRIISRG